MGTNLIGLFQERDKDFLKHMGHLLCPVLNFQRTGQAGKPEGHLVKLAHLWIL